MNILYYNKDLLDKAGVKYPDEKWTWDDLLIAAEKLTVKDASGAVKQYALAMENNNKYDKWVNQMDGAILDDMRNPSKCMLADNASMDAVAYFAGMMNFGYAMRDADINQAGGDAGAFQSGQAAMIIQNTSRVSGFNKAGMNYDVAVVPIPPQGQALESGRRRGWVMSAKSDNKDAAWTFLQWLQSAERRREAVHGARRDLPGAAIRGQLAGLHDRPAAGQQAGDHHRGGGVGRGRLRLLPGVGRAGQLHHQPGPGQDLDRRSGPAEKGLPELCKQVDQFLKDKGYPKK